MFMWHCIHLKTRKRHFSKVPQQILCMSIHSIEREWGMLRKISFLGRKIYYLKLSILPAFLSDFFFLQFWCPNYDFPGQMGWAKMFLMTLFQSNTGPWVLHERILFLWIKLHLLSHFPALTKTPTQSELQNRHLKYYFCC